MNSFTLCAQSFKRYPPPPKFAANMIAEVEDYLRNPKDYSRGCELLRKFQPDFPLHSLLASGDSSFTRSKLHKALVAISAEKPVETPPESVPPLNAFRRQSESKMIRIDYSKLPELLKVAIREKDALFKQSAELHRMLTLDISNDQRRTMAMEILSNFDRIDQIWKDAENFQLHGILPGADKVEAGKETALDLARMLENLKKNAYKVKDKPERRARYDELCAQIQEVEDALSKR